MSFPKGRHLDSIAYSRKTSCDSGLHRAIWRSNDNLSGNAILMSQARSQAQLDGSRMITSGLAKPDSPLPGCSESVTYVLC